MNKTKERREQILKRRQRVGRVYVGQIVCAETYKEMDANQRSFWNKCYKQFRKGNTIFDWNDEAHVVPWALSDGSFYSLKHLQEMQEKIDKEEQEKNGDINGVSNEGTVVGSESDNLVEDTVA